MLPRFQHILVPLDFSSKNRMALDVAFELASQNRARTSLLHVVERIETSPDDEDSVDRELEEFYGQLEARAESELESVSQRFEAAGLDVEYKVWRGKRVHEIVKFSHDRDVDLVVLSSHPVDADQPVKSLTTVSYQVSILCACPVLMVK
ncbi:MAG: universal stress protein [Planctomycetota bacterium]|nr:MAG: universal stress protein [Planctomycetota bacterium]